MKTRYKKVQVSERLPKESTELYFYCNDGYCNDGDYNKEFNVFKDVDGTRYGVEYVDHWLEEVPDYEDEILAMLERMKINIVFTSVRGFDKPLTLEEVDKFSKDVDDLIEKIKYGKVS